MKMRRVLIPLLLLISAAAFSQNDIVYQVRTALAGGDLSSAQSLVSRYKGQHGVDSPYLEALSWVARGALEAKQLDLAQKTAAETEALTSQKLQKHSVDSDPQLATALGAAIEVQAQALAAQNQNAKAVALLRRNLVTYHGTSIEPRLQKNLNLLSLAGQPAPPLSTTEYLGVQPSTLAKLKGSPVLLFFWAHWCVDCKQEAPIISQLSSEFAPKGLSVLAPTQLYGYAAGGEAATPKDETAYIGRVWQHYYPALQSVAVPISKANFTHYGASTTPTLVLIDRKGHVAMYHPGLMQYDDLRAAIQKVL